MGERLRVREIDDDEGRRLARIIRRGSGPVVTWRRQRAIRLALGLDDPQAIGTGQRRSDIAGHVPPALWVMVSLSKIHDLKRPRAS